MRNVGDVIDVERYMRDERYGSLGKIFIIFNSDCGQKDGW